LAAAPAVDGDLGDWAGATWTRVPIQPAEDKEEVKAVGNIEVELAAGVRGGIFYVAARWPDTHADEVYRPWRIFGGKYRRSDDRDDAFALRLHMDGDYDKCMITSKTYKVDVWLWSAGRSNPAGMADDYHHLISSSPLEDAAEHKTPSGATVYIKKNRDEGTPGWENTRAPKEVTTDQLPGVAVVANPSGSAADITAKGKWAGGKWSLEMSRKLDTGHPDDAVLKAGAKSTGAIAVFNHSHSDNKSVSGLLEFDFSAVK
ncbi:MAG: ethylbenzene dehydrogenase-related protein, partial [Alphaproteobacteria bacterium]